ncbi:MAG TPA: serine hydrolase domain-containing protein [Candidatus Koribacter sp.]|jgi:CubicO group peptidase (beta-lactamase class C family)
MRRVFVLLLIAWCVPAIAQRQTLGERDVHAVENILSETMTANHITGASIGIVMNGQIVWTHGYGMSDLEGNVVARDTTEYRLGSISKPISAVAAMTLVEQHKLDLDVPIQKYCPAFPQKQAPITTRQLLSHTSGIRHYKPQDPDVEHGAEETRHFNSINDALAKFANDPLEFAPGSKFGYSTYGYTVVGCVIEGASGEKFFDYLHDTVLKPAGMEHTLVDNLQAVIPDRTRYYDQIDGKVINAGLMDSSYKVPGGGLISSVDDMSEFMVAMMKNKVLSADTTALMWTPVTKMEGNRGYGLGFGMFELNGMKAVAHSGAQKGTSTTMLMIPEKQFGVVILTNMESEGALSKATNEIVAALLK